VEVGRDGGERDLRPLDREILQEAWMLWTKLSFEMNEGFAIENE